jgi:hypothetical protein
MQKKIMQSLANKKPAAASGSTRPTSPNHADATAAGSPPAAAEVATPAAGPAAGPAADTMAAAPAAVVDATVTDAPWPADSIAPSVEAGAAAVAGATEAVVAKSDPVAIGATVKCYLTASYVACRKSRAKQTRLQGYDATAYF